MFRCGKYELIVIGYAGNDNSVMSVLEELIREDGIKKGVYWCKPKGSNLSIRACKFMETACNVNEQSAIVEIEAFDDLMYSLYLAMNLKNSSIDELWKGHDKKQDILYYAIGKHTATVITNALPAMQFPRKCYVFSSSITTWKELRATTNNSCVAILYKGKVWTLGSKSGILEAFADKNISNIEEMDIPIYMMKLEHSDVITLVNAVFHKSYREPEPVEIRIYVDSIQILNYPGLAKWINLERFVSGKVKGRKYRNRRIGELFKEIDLSEKKGTGIPKILRELKQNGSPEPEFDMDEERTYLNAIIRIRDGFERKEKMSESMSELERARMQIILIYLETNKEINSAAAAKLLEVEIKTASRLLLKAEKLNILKGTGKTKNKVYKK